jgi:hypothetical protein
MKSSLAAVMMFLPAVLFAQSPFDGTWKMNLDASKPSPEPLVFSVSNGMYNCTSCVPEVHVKGDGSDQSVTGLSNVTAGERNRLPYHQNCRQEGWKDCFGADKNCIHISRNATWPAKRLQLSGQAVTSPTETNNLDRSTLRDLSVPTEAFDSYSGPDVARDLRYRCAGQKIPWLVHQSTQGFWRAAALSLAELRSASARAALARALRGP